LGDRKASWLAPSDGVFKMNVDATCQGNAMTLALAEGYGARIVIDVGARRSMMRLEGGCYWRVEQSLA